MEKSDCRRKLVKKRPVEATSQTAMSPCKRSRIMMENPERSEEGAKKESDEPVELDERTAQILDEELQAVMIKVWQCLPDSPPSAAEKYVTERLRNEASDDIRNVLGLNVTKRLLNIYNPLIVIVHFTSDPTLAQINQFMRAYNIRKMKRHAHSLNLHVATMSCIQDFDRLCTANNLRCGDAVVKVKPTYRFTISPARLKSVFTKQSNTASKSKEGESSENIAEAVTNNKNVKDSTDATPVKEQGNNNQNKNDQAASLNVESKHTVQNETSKPNVAKKQESIQNVTPNKKPDSENSASQDIVSANKPNVTEAATEKNVIKTDSKTSALNNNSKPIQVKQEVVADTTSPKAAETATEIKPNQGNQKIVEVTPKSAKSDENPNATKPSLNQNNNQAAAKNVTPTTPKLTVKTAESINATIPNPNQKTVAVSEKVTESTTPKPAMKNSETKPNPSPNKPQVAVTTNVTETTPKPTMKNSETIIATKPTPNLKTTQVAVTEKVIVSTQKPAVTVKNNEANNATIPKANQNNTQAVAAKNVSAIAPKPAVKNNETINATKANSNQKPQVAVTKKVTVATPKLTVKSDSNAPKPKVNQTKVATKKTEPIPKSTKKIFEPIDPEEFDEDDVMDDEEILALISSGVVLDECSGSDDD